MDDITKKKLFAGAKIGLGVLRMGSAIVTGTGHGLVGTFMKNHGMARTAVELAKRSFHGGMAMADQGFEDWKNAK